MSEQPLMRVTGNSVVIDHGAYTTVDIRESRFTRRIVARVRRHGFAIGFAVLFLLAGSIEHASAW